jgi:hypothetical protein
LQTPTKSSERQKNHVIHEALPFRSKTPSFRSATVSFRSKNPVIPLKKPCHSAQKTLSFRPQWRNLLFSRPNSIPLPKAKLHKAGATVEERRFSAA